MEFFAYAESKGRVGIDYAGRDEAAGIIGSVTAKPEPIGSAGNKEDAIEMAYAHLGRNPSDMVYVADSGGLLYEIVINRAYGEERDRAGKWQFMAWSILVFCLVCFVATLTLGLGFKGLLLFGGITLLYVLVIRTGIQNEVEEAAVCLIILVLICILVPGLRAARRESRDGEARTNHPLYTEPRTSLFDEFRVVCRGPGTVTLTAYPNSSTHRHQSA